MSRRPAVCYCGATGEDECVSPQSNFITAMAVIVIVVPFSVDILSMAVTIVLPFCDRKG